MDFADRIKALAAGIPAQLEHIHTEEATKTALVMPFIYALGYNVFDPTEVVPELAADVGTKKGEKVDYAILKEGRPIILFECKCCDCALDTSHASQLFRYFTVTAARFAVLTNGLVYRFFSDLDDPNKMDDEPFFEFDMREITDLSVERLGRFRKSAYVEDEILGGARELKATTVIKTIMAEQLVAPSDDFVRLCAPYVYPGRLTQGAKLQLAEVIQRALNEFITDRVNDRLRDAIEQRRRPEPAASQGEPEVIAQEEDAPRVVTTDEEREAFYIVKAILRDVVDPNRVHMRDALSYCSVLLDDTNRKPLCRLRFNGPRKCIGVFDAQKQEERCPVTCLDDIYRFAEQLKATPGYYDKA